MLVFATLNFLADPSGSSGDLMTRKVFFSFHYFRDIARVNSIRKVPQIVGVSAAGFADASLRESLKSTNPDYLKRKIRENLRGTSLTVVCIGKETSKRPWVDFEIAETLA